MDERKLLEEFIEYVQKYRDTTELEKEVEHFIRWKEQKKT